jgi:hypothetical protein
VSVTRITAYCGANAPRRITRLAGSFYGQRVVKGINICKIGLELAEKGVNHQFPAVSRWKNTERVILHRSR